MRWQSRRFHFERVAVGIDDQVLPTRDVLYRGPHLFEDIDGDIRRYLGAMLATVRPSSHRRHLVLAGALQVAIEAPTWRTLMRGVWSALNAMLPEDDLLFATGDDVAGAMLRINLWLVLVGFPE